MRVHVDHQFTNKTWSYYHYNNFSVGSANEEYPLTAAGFIGEGSDWFQYHNNHKFSTSDNDNDETSCNCVAVFKGGWWYNKGRFHININLQPPNARINALNSEMKIRPKNCNIQ